MAQRDENEEAVSNVERATDSEPVRGEELLESPELKRKLGETSRLENLIGQRSVSPLSNSRNTSSDVI